MLNGIDITLYTKTKTGEDEFHAPVYEETPVTVRNVLVGEPATEDIVNDLQLYGRRLAYTLAMPKGDAHDWRNVTVEFFGQKFRTYGDVVQGIDDLIPAVLEQEGEGGNGMSNVKIVLNRAGGAGTAPFPRNGRYAQRAGGFHKG